MLTFMQSLYSSLYKDYGIKNTLADVYKDGDKISTYKSEIFTSKFVIGSTFSNSVVSGFELGYENYQTNYYEGDKTYTDFKGNKQFAFLKPFLYLDTLDNKAFPSKNRSLALLLVIGLAATKLSPRARLPSSTVMYPVWVPRP